LITLDVHLEGRNPFREGRRRGPGFGVVLETVPRAGDAAVDDLALAERAVLVSTDVRDRGDFAVPAKHRHTFPGNGDHLGAALRDLRGTTHRNQPVATRARLAIGDRLEPTGAEV